MSYTPALIALGKNIRKIRKQKKMTMEELSIISDIEYRQIGRIERAEVNTTIISLVRIAIALKVDIREFLNDVLETDFI
jgi:transcriptional regulator with XRE-family HTH domain